MHYLLLLHYSAISISITYLPRISLVSRRHHASSHFFREPGPPASSGLYSQGKALQAKQVSHQLPMSAAIFITIRAGRVTDVGERSFECFRDPVTD